LSLKNEKYRQNKQNIVVDLSSKPMFIDEYHETRLEWSYINEDCESKNITQQIEYNQTLSDLIIELNVDNIMVNSKLKPLFQTLNSYNQNTNYINKTKVTFIDSNTNQKVIYCYNDCDLKPLLNEVISDQGLVYNINLRGKKIKQSTPITRLNITNIDDGVFGIKNRLIRVENGSKLILYMSEDVDLEYIKEIMNFNRGFSGIKYVDLIKPKTKYSYHIKKLAEIKNKK
jgi:hypothetical protein